MKPQISDHFNGPPGLLDDHATSEGYAWAHPFGVSPFTIASGVTVDAGVDQSGAQPAGVYFVQHQSSSSDFSAEVDVDYPNNTDPVEAALAIRYDGASPPFHNAYFVSWVPDSSTVQLCKVNTGIVTVFGEISVPVANKHTLKISASGSTISAWCDGALVATATDDVIVGLLVGIGSGLRNSRYGSFGQNSTSYDNLVVT